MSRIPADVIAELVERSGGYCEIGGAPLYGDYQHHHRKRRGMGGDRRQPEDTAANLLVAHPECHDWVHKNRRLAYEHHFSLFDGQDPAATPVLLLRGLCRIPC